MLPARRDTQCCDKLVALLRKKFDKHLDLFEMYSLRNIFRVPDDVHVRSWCRPRPSLAVAAIARPSPGTLVTAVLTRGNTGEH